MAKGELFAIWEALSVECQEEETDLHFFTDNIVTIHVIRKGLMRPWLLKGHEHEGTIRELIQTIAGRGKEHNTVVVVHFHKVKAHTGVRGNEVADGLAKCACTDPEHETTREEEDTCRYPRSTPSGSHRLGGVTAE